MICDWTQSGLSNHQALKLTHLAKEMTNICPDGFLLPIDNAGNLLRFIPAKPKWKAIATFSNFASSGAIDTSMCITFSYSYRDGGNYKQHHESRFQGTLNDLDIAILATAFNAGEDESFIPSQIGLDDLQPEWGDDDHVWHSFEGMALSPLSGSNRDICILLKKARKICADGCYDLMAAIDLHQA